MTPRPPDTPPRSSHFLVSPRALAWLKRQLWLMLDRKEHTRTDTENLIMTTLSGDPDVSAFFAARRSADQGRAAGCKPV
jgi:hypothetical protein